uniref:Uncharacterized protein n=1 Tax=Anguilla anguilla TaxID=7936 RepID=A0A0E9SX23_ANGAN
MKKLQYYILKTLESQSVFILIYFKYKAGLCPDTCIEPIIIASNNFYCYSGSVKLDKDTENELKQF